MKRIDLTKEHRSLGHYEWEILELLARGEKEIEEGKGYDLDAVFAEADALLEQMRLEEEYRRPS